MCNFFSLVSDGLGNSKYFDWTQREKILNKKLYAGKNLIETADSHSSLCAFFAMKEDESNKYEYNPVTKEFKIDQMNTSDDSKKIKKFCESLDFKTVIPQLNLHPIVHTLKVKRKKKTPSKKEIQLLKDWASARASVWASVRASVWDSVWASVRASVGDSVWDSARAYTGSYFILQEWKYCKTENGKYPFQPCVDLWNAGLVPSFDGTTWRLHSGEKAEIVYEWSKK